MTAPEQPTIRSGLADKEGRIPIGVHLDLLATEVVDTAQAIRRATAGRPQGTTTFLTTMAEGLIQSADRLLTAWREHFPAPPASPRPPVPVDPGAPMAAGRPSSGKGFGYRVAEGRVTLADGRSFPVSDIKIETSEKTFGPRLLKMAPLSGWQFEFEGGLTPVGAEVIGALHSMAKADDPWPDAEGLAAARLDHAFVMRPGGPVEDGCWYDVPGSGTCGRPKDRHRPTGPTPGDQVAAVMDRIERAIADGDQRDERLDAATVRLAETMDAAKAARARHLRKGTRVRVVEGHPLLGGVEATVWRSGPDFLGRVSVEAVLPGLGLAIIDNLRRDDLVVPLQPGDRVAWKGDPDREPFEVLEVLPDGFVIVDDGDGNRSDPIELDRWERLP